MYTINNFINHYSLERYKKIFEALSTDPMINNRLATFDKEAFDSRVKFLGEKLERIFNKLEPSPTDEDKQAIIRGVLSAENCGSIGDIFPSEFIYKLKKEWPKEIVLTLLSRSKMALISIERIAHQIRYYNKRIPYNPALMSFLVQFDDNQLDYLAECNNLMLIPDSLGNLSSLVQETLQGQSRCEWYDLELEKAKNNRDPSIITKLMASQEYQQYSALRYKKPTTTLIEFVIRNDFDEFIDPVIGGDPKKLGLALTTAILQNKAPVVKKLCAMGALQHTRDALSTATYEARNLEIFEILLKAGANVDEMGFTGHFAAEIHSPQNGERVREIHLKMFTLLLQTRRSQRLAYPLSLMVEYNDPGLLRLLIEYGAVEQLDKNSPSLMSLAIEKDALEVVGILMAAGQSLDEKVIDSYVPKSNHYFSLGSTEHKDQEAELPVIRASLREALKSLSNTPGSSVNFLREKMNEIFDAKQDEQANTTKTLHTAYTFLTHYKSKKTWGAQYKPLIPHKWEEGDNLATRSGVIKQLIGHPVKIISKDNYSDKLKTHEGLLRWFGPEDPVHGLISVEGYGYGIYIKNVRDLSLCVKNKPEAKI